MHACSSKNLFSKHNNKLNLLIGPPNVGKSSFFNLITWQNSAVGNIDKVTTTSKLGTLRFDKKVKFMDMPGVYSLDPNTSEESVVIEYLIQKQFDKIINIVSATSLKRDLMLTISLLESGLLDNIVINMVDELEDNSINQFRMIRKLGVNVDCISVLKNTGIKVVLNNIINFSSKKDFFINYPIQIEALINKLEKEFKFEFNVSNRFLAIQFLEGNRYIHKLFHEFNVYDKCMNIVYKSNFESINQTKKIIRNTKNIFINTLYIDCVNSSVQIKQNKRIIQHRKIDKFLLNKWIAIPLFIFVMILVYYLSFGPYTGGWIKEQLNDNGLEKLQTIINNSMVNSGIRGFWANFVSDGMFGGIFTVIGFLPNIIIVFGLVFIIEQTGFLSRIGVVLDRQFNKFGLSGRSIITLLTGVGCNITSILTARNSQSQKEKKIILLISPLIACSARLVVFDWIAGALVGVQFAWLISLSLTVFSGIIALFIGLFFSSTMFRKKTTFFLTELPPWRRPKFLFLLKSTANEVWGFVKRVITIIALVNLAVFILLNISPKIGLIDEVNYVNEFNYESASLLEYISLGFKYIFYPIGLGEDWRLSMSLVTAAPAKEIAASNLELLFKSTNETISSNQNFANSIKALKSPIATSVSFLFFLIFYTPCLSTTVVLKKEGSWKWMWIHLITAFVFSYMLSFISYGVLGTFENIVNNYGFVNNIFNIINLLLLVLVFASLIINTSVKYWFNKQNKINFKINKKFNLIYIITSSLFLLTIMLMVINIYTFK